MSKDISAYLHSNYLNETTLKHLGIEGALHQRSGKVQCDAPLNIRFLNYHTFNTGLNTLKAAEELIHKLEGIQFILYYPRGKHKRCVLPSKGKK